MAKVLWTQKQDLGPRPRAGHAMAYDTARRRVVLFGGDSLAGTRFGDTWEWDGDSWTQVQDIGPASRAFHAMAFDSVRNRAVLFGGRGGDARLGDTWEWDGENWTQVAGTGPSPRSGHAMAFDSRRQRVVLFGGESDTEAARFNDTWEWDGDEWVQQADSGPSPRVGAAMAFDSTRNRLVLFGGAAEDAGLSDTWEWDGTAWTEESDFGPDPCAGAAAVFKGTQVALFGGITSITGPSPTLFNRSWEWNGRHWTARQDMGPEARAFHAMAFDAARSRVVLFGGSRVTAAGNDARGDTWEQFDSQPASAPPPPPPPPGFDLAAVPNPANPGDVVTITVTVPPVPVPVVVNLLLDGQFLGTIQIPAQTTQGTLQFQIPVEQVPGPLTILASSGESETSIVLTIEPPVQVDIVALAAVPNPVPPGQAVAITVTLGTSAPDDTNVILTADQQPFGTIPISADANTGQVQLTIPLDTPPMTVVLRAVSGASHAETTLQIGP